MKYAIAVIDIGMTNKKVAIYDDNLVQLDAAYTSFGPKMVDLPGTGRQIETHNLEGMRQWFFDSIREFAKKWPIKAIAVSTHGATAVCIGEDGKVCAPCVFYTEEPGEAFQEEFYRIAGSRLDLQKETASPAFASLLNVAKTPLFLKKYFPAEFARTKTLLFYAQYWGYVLTGKFGVEPTLGACHTCLWDHERLTWSPVVDRLGIRGILPEKCSDTCSVLGTLKSDVAAELCLPESTAVTLGIHDSNASLLPYLAKEGGNDFVLNSTGSWCVAMHPQKKIEFNGEDIGKIVFFNQSALGTPVKTAIFVGGMEFNAWVSCWRKINGLGEDAFPSHTEETVNALLGGRDTFLLPELVAGSGQFVGSKPGIMEKGKFYSFEDVESGRSVPDVMRDEHAFLAVLEASLVIQTETALRRAGLKPGTKVFTEGGFRKNALYNSLLPTVLSDNQTYRTSMAEATAAGAAMTAIIALSGKKAEEAIAGLADTIHIDYRLDKPCAFKGYEAYKQDWLALARG